MHQFYSISLPTEAAIKPAHWSFSSLEAWRLCPRRWWLLHSKYDGRSYPIPLAPSGVRGQLVHRALEAYSLRLHGSVQGEFDVRKFIRSSLDESLSSQAADNPRVNASILRAKFSIDEAVAFFWKIAEHFEPTAPRGPLERQYAAEGDQPTGPEVWIELSDPPLCGRIDLVENRRLIEFKTAEEDERHAEQLRFYALLWWLRTGSLPDKLTLAYVHADRWLDVAVPTVPEIKNLCDEYRLITTTANDAIDRRTTEAHTSEETCRYCPVRQLCGEYWQATTTLPLRNPTDGVETAFLDVRLTGFPNTWCGSGALSGLASADVLGEVSIFIGANKCPNFDSRRPQSAVLLGARAERDGPRWKITALPASEVFWTI